MEDFKEIVLLHLKIMAIAFIPVVVASFLVGWGICTLLGQPYW